jgi:hypothetical protein
MDRSPTERSGEEEREKRGDGHKPSGLAEVFDVPMALLTKGR